MPKPNFIKTHTITPHAPTLLNRDGNGMAVRLPPSLTAALFGRMVTTNSVPHRGGH